jgi:uncharacterized repeat protein (TIGR02543 family)
MRKLLVILLLTLVIGMTFAATANDSEFVVKAQTPIHKIMPLGDSITLGYPGLDGYRKDLYLDLNNSGFSVDFVGSQSDGMSFDPNHEGHIGYNASNIRDGVYNWLINNPADVVLLHIGTNDMENETKSVPETVSEVGDILNEIDRWELYKGESVTVVLARIILRSDSLSLNNKTLQFDDALEAMALSRIANGDNIVIVDMEHALNYPGDLVDGIHPTQTGYGKMADVWYNALIKILGYKLTVTTNFGTTIPTVGEYWYPAGSIVTIASFSPTNGSNDRYVWLGWTGSGLGSYTGLDNNTNLVVMNGPINETASWAHQYLLFFTSSGLGADATGNLASFNVSNGSYSGAISPIGISGGSIWVDNGAIVTYSYVDSVTSGMTGKHYRLNSITGLTSPIVVSGFTTVTGNYLTQFQLTMNTNFGSLSPASGNWYDAGTSVNIYAVSPGVGAGERYVWNGWTGSGSGSYTGVANNTNLVVMNGPVTETASWTHQFYLTVSSPYGDTDGEGWYNAGSSASATISSTIATGSGGVQYTFSGWSGGASGSSSTSNIIVMDGPKTAIANWSPVPTATPKPTPTPTIRPTITPTSTPTLHPTVSPSFSPSPTPSSLSPSPTNVPILNANTLVLEVAVLGVVLIGGTVGIFVLRKRKTSKKTNAYF